MNLTRDYCNFSPFAGWSLSILCVIMACQQSYSIRKSMTLTTLPSNLRRDHPRMRAFSYACSLSVTWRRWRLHHSTRRSVCCMQNHGLERELLPIEVLHCENRNFRPFWLLWPWPWSDDHHDLHIRTRPVDRGDMPHVPIWTSYVKAFESYRLIDIHTDRHDQNYTPRRFAGGQKRPRPPGERGYSQINALVDAVAILSSWHAERSV